MKILCIKKSLLKKSPYLQKEDDTIKKVIENFTFIEESEIPEEYVPLDVAVTIRSAYTNKVVLCTHSDSNKERCFLNLTKLPQVQEKGYDLVILYSSIAVMRMCDQSRAREVGEVMIQSKYDFMGVLNLEPGLINPILYSHVILEDSTVEAFEPLLAEGFRLIPIADLPEHGNFKAMKESLIICKEEENEQCDNN